MADYARRSYRGQVPRVFRFLPTGLVHAAVAITVGGLARATAAPTEAPREAAPPWLLIGIVGPASQPHFRVLTVATGETAWLKAGSLTPGLVVQNYDARAETIWIEKDGRSWRLMLRERMPARETGSSAAPATLGVQAEAWTQSRSRLLFPEF